MNARSPGREPIRRSKLGDEVRDRLLGILDGGDLAPGDRFPSERELMARFDVGRPAVREAMQSLQGMGLIEVRQGERPRVASPTLAGSLALIGPSMRQALTHSEPVLKDLKEVRVLAERYIARVAAERRTPEDVEGLRAIVARQGEAAGVDGTTFMRLDGEFHAAIAAIVGNPVIVNLVEAGFAWLSEFHVQAVHRPGLETLTIDEHVAIIDAIESGDGPRASGVMADHLNRANALYRSGHRLGAEASRGDGDGEG